MLGFGRSWTRNVDSMEQLDAVVVVLLDNESTWPEVGLYAGLECGRRPTIDARQTTRSTDLGLRDDEEGAGELVITYDRARARTRRHRRCYAI